MKSTCTKCVNVGSMKERAVSDVSRLTMLDPNVTATNMSPTSVAAAVPTRT